MQNDELTLIEQGYVNSSVRYQRGSSDAKHKIAIVFKSEFPRSHQFTWFRKEMVKTQVEFYEHGCKAFFKKHRKKHNEITTMISAAVNREVTTGMTKVKLATRKKIAGKSLYEFRLNVGKIGSVRIAFTKDQDKVIIYFISSHLQKATFTHELDRVIDKIN